MVGLMLLTLTSLGTSPPPPPSESVNEQFYMMWLIPTISIVSVVFIYLLISLVWDPIEYCKEYYKFISNPKPLIKPSEIEICTKCSKNKITAPTVQRIDIERNYSRR